MGWSICRVNLIFSILNPYVGKWKALEGCASVNSYASGCGRQALNAGTATHFRRRQHSQPVRTTHGPAVHICKKISKNKPSGQNREQKNSLNHTEASVNVRRGRDTQELF